ncbi:MAG: hypothetical protein HXL18_00935 [Peptostreptococcus sp.]|nr:hypothetical protein [Peptostreptococcus sp.]
MITVCAIYDFKDKEEGVYRKVGERFEVSKERYFEILEKGGDWVVPVAKISKEDLENRNEADSGNPDSENSSDNIDPKEDEKPEKRKKSSKRKSEDKGE